MSEAATLQPTVIETDPSASFVCDYVAGVNRVLSLPPYLLVDNIGRNFEVWQFATGGSEPIARARYDLTSYPGDPIASLLDVDIHAAFRRGDRHELLTINHYGRVRAFDFPTSGGPMQPAWERQLLGDMERVVMAGDCFIASSPRGEFTDDPAQPGIFLFESVKPMTNELRLSFEQALADWGVVDALAVSANENRLAVAGALRLAVFDLRYTSTGVRLGDCLWEAPLTFHCQWLQFDDTEHLMGGRFSTAVFRSARRRLGGLSRRRRRVLRGRVRWSPLHSHFARGHRLGLRRRPRHPGSGRSRALCSWPRRILICHRGAERRPPSALRST